MDTIIVVEIEYDKAKDAKNRAKHSLSLEDAERLDWNAALTVPDKRRSYGEERFTASVPMAGRLHVVVFTLRGTLMRIISLRKANRRENKRYEAQVRKSQN